jgi:hypothetical protein
MFKEGNIRKRDQGCRDTEDGVDQLAEHSVEPRAIIVRTRPVAAEQQLVAAVIFALPRKSGTLPMAVLR